LFYYPGWASPTRSSPGRLLSETSRQISNTDIAPLRSSYWHLIRSPKFLGYAIGGGCATTSLYGFVASAPFIFVDQLHRPTHETGIYLAILTSGLWLGSIITSHLIVTIPLRTLLITANGLSVFAAFAFLALTVCAQVNLALLVGLMFLFSIGVGSAAPAALSQAISVNQQAIGSASGLYGFIQMAVGATLMRWLAWVTIRHRRQRLFCRYWNRRARLLLDGAVA
jgi:DHA1 family bicyclomycin/chloramphenicol resistance-like MFS transporter